MSDTGRPILEMRDLRIAVRSGSRAFDAVRGVSLEVMPGEVLAIVGESGSGKTLTALSVLGLLPRAAANVVGGEILFEGCDLVRAGEVALNAVRGRGIAMIFQEPLSALNPVMRIGDQIVEGLVARGELSRAAARERAVVALTDVRISDPERRLRQYPHELSGGMRQRVMIALALISAPRLLIADEPTTALDVTVQAQVLTLLKSLQSSRGLSMIVITHDLGIVADIADRVAVMYAGCIVESGPVETILGAPSHPYTVGLLSCLPEFSGEGRRLNVVPGSIPTLAEEITGCRFKMRCPLYVPGPCDSPVPLAPLSAGHLCRCVRPLAHPAAAAV